MKSFIKLVLIYFSFVLCQQNQPATQKPINTIKSEKNSYYEFEEKHGDFREVLESDIKIIYVHARKAILKGFSPKKNRTVPKLNYDFFSHFSFEI